MQKESRGFLLWAECGLWLLWCRPELGEQDTGGQEHWSVQEVNENHLCVDGQRHANHL